MEAKRLGRDPCGIWSLSSSVTLTSSCGDGRSWRFCLSFNPSGLSMLCVSVWIKMELCILGPIISEALPVFDRSGHLQSAPFSMQIAHPVWLSASGFSISHNKSVSVATRKMCAITLLCFLFVKYIVPFSLN